MHRMYTHCIAGAVRASSKQQAATISTVVAKSGQNDSITLPFKRDVSLSPGLYLVATPIGNLEDITIRALRVLTRADVILAEDCRHTQKLLNHYGIVAPMRSYHMHNESLRSTELLSLLSAGQIVALVSDAGTPGISDPGTLAVSVAARAGFSVVPVPGPAAAVAALTGSALPTDEFHFVGFLPARSAARCSQLEGLRRRTSATMVFYVPPHSLLDVLKDMISVLGGERRCCVTREVTKVHETFYRDTLAGALQHFSAGVVRGEITLVVQGSSEEDMLAGPAAEMSVEERLRQLLAEGQSITGASKQVSVEFSVKKKVIYQTALAVQEQLKMEDGLKA